MTSSPVTEMILPSFSAILVTSWRNLRAPFHSPDGNVRGRRELSKRVGGGMVYGGPMPLLHPTDQSGSSLGVHTEVTSTWRARGVDRGGFPVAILSG